MIGFMDVYACLWMFMDVYGCLWMFMDVYGCLLPGYVRHGDILR